MTRLRVIVLLALTAACNSETIDPEEATRLVVEGFLYTDQAVEGLKVSQLIPFNAEEGSSYAIDDAEVEIAVANEVFTLEPRRDGTGIYDYLGTGLGIQEGVTYQLSLRYESEFVEATTTVPPAPRGIAISEEIIEMPPITNFQDLRNLREQEPIDVTWDNAAGDYYYVLVENIEVNPEEINQLEFGGRPNFALITQPTTLDNYRVRPNDMTQYGIYRVVVYRVNQEYVDLYETSEPDSRNLTEPLTNVENGLGIFTSFNSDTIYFEIVKP